MVGEELIDEIFTCQEMDDILEIITREELTQEEVDEVAEGVFSRAIANFSPPEEYNEESHFMHPLVNMAVKKEATELHSYLNATTHEQLATLAERYERGLRAYLDEEPYCSTFVFLTVQDGMMTWLCENDGVRKDNDGYYSLERKRNFLAGEYRTNIAEGDRLDSPFDTGEIVQNLESIYDHRNEIMHGGPEAVFDMNIATVSLLFVIATFEIVYEYREIEPIKIPKEYMIPDF